MSVKRFTGSDIRELMSRVKLELGEDAVIVSNRKIPGGMEIVAMSDEGFQSITEESQASLPVPPPAQKIPAVPLPTEKVTELRAKPVSAPIPDVTLSFQEQLLKRSELKLPNPFKAEVEPVDDRGHPIVTQHRQSVGKAAYAHQASSDLSIAEGESAEVRVKLTTSGIAPKPQAPARAPEPEPEPVIEVFEAELVDDYVEPEPAGPVLPTAAERFAEDLRKARAITEWSSQMVGDLNSMQDLIRRQILPRVSQSAVYAEINQLLAKAGFQRDLCTQMLSSLPGELAERRMDRNGISRWIEHALVEQISVIASPEVWWGGRTVVAMVGSNGVGKSTAIAKLAARFVMENAPSEIVILTTDTENNESLRNHADVMGIDCRVIEDYEDLSEVIRSLSYKRVVLLDTPGFSYRHKRLKAGLERLAKVYCPIKVMLVLNASSEAESLEAMASAYLTVAEQVDLKLSDCLVTKLDEAVRVGALISTMARHKLRLNYQSSGNGVLEDFERGSALSLVRQSMDCFHMGVDISAVDGTRDSGEQFDIMRNTLLDNVGEMTQVLASIRREFKNAGFAEATRSITGTVTARKDQQFARLIEEQKGTELVASTSKPEVLWFKNDYPVESAYFNLASNTPYADKGQSLSLAVQPQIRSVN